MYSKLSDIIKNRRSIRVFNNKDVDVDLVRQIIETASHAPSNNNRQGWKFYIIKSKPVINQIYRQVVEKLEGCENKSQVFDEVLTSYKKNFTVFHDAPVLVVCCFVKPGKFQRKIFNTDESNNHMSGELISVSLVMQNIMLLSESLGIGSLIMTAPLIASEQIKKIINIPNKYRIGSFIPMGYYDNKPDPPAHLPYEKIIEII